MARTRSQKSVVITHLMVDIDGVVVTGRPKDGAHWSTGLQGDLGMDPGLLQKHFFRLFWHQVVTGQLPLRATLQKILPTFTNVPADKLIHYWFVNDSRLNNDVLNTLENARLAGMIVYFATNQEPERSAYLWHSLGLKNHADGILTSAELGVKKPDTRFFAKAAEHTAAHPESHHLIDDTIENIKAAQAAKWQATHWHENATFPIHLS